LWKEEAGEKKEKLRERKKEKSSFQNGDAQS
jgi:hypothetical protein